MSEERLIIQMGQGIDAGGDVQAAALAAIAQARSHAVLPEASVAGGRWVLSLGVPDVAAVDAEAMRAAVPAGAEVAVRAGGLSVGRSVAVVAALEVFVPVRAAS